MRVRWSSSAQSHGEMNIADAVNAQFATIVFISAEDAGLLRVCSTFWKLW